MLYTLRLRRFYLINLRFKIWRISSRCFKVLIESVRKSISSISRSLLNQLEPWFFRSYYLDSECNIKDPSRFALDYIVWN